MESILHDFINENHTFFYCPNSKAILPKKGGCFLGIIFFEDIAITRLKKAGILPSPTNEFFK